jgi:hypothetical protein
MLLNAMFNPPRSFNEIVKHQFIPRILNRRLLLFEFKIASFYQRKLKPLTFHTVM